MSREKLIEGLRSFALGSANLRAVFDMFLTDAMHRDKLLFELLQCKMLEVEILIKRLTK